MLDVIHQATHFVDAAFHTLAYLGSSQRVAPSRNKRPGLRTTGKNPTARVEFAYVWKEHIREKVRALCGSITRARIRAARKESQLYATFTILCSSSGLTSLAALSRRQFQVKGWTSSVSYHSWALRLRQSRPGMYLNGCQTVPLQILLDSHPKGGQDEPRVRIILLCVNSTQVLGVVGGASHLHACNVLHGDLESEGFHSKQRGS